MARPEPPPVPVEKVTADPADIALLGCVLADRQGVTWTLAPALAAALHHDGPVVVEAFQLWDFLNAADPEEVYDLDEAEETTHERMDVRAHHRLEAAFYRQAPLAAAVTTALMDAEVAFWTAPDGPAGPGGPA
jgi:hypothetical protein